MLVKFSKILTNPFPHLESFISTQIVDNIIHKASILLIIQPMKYIWSNKKEKKANMRSKLLVRMPTNSLTEPTLNSAIRLP